MSLSYWPCPSPSPSLSPSSSCLAPFRCPPMAKPTNPFPSSHFIPIPFNPPLQIPILTLNSKNRRSTISFCSSNSSAVAAETTGATASNGHPPGVVKRARRSIRPYPGEKEVITEEMRSVAMKLRNVKGDKVEADTASNGHPPGVVKRARRSIRQYPGQKEGITEEMRFVAMKLRNVKGDKVEADSSDEGEEGGGGEGEDDDDGGGYSGSVDEDGGGGGGKTWMPTMEGFVKYLVDSKHVFDFVEQIVDESDDVSYAYFRKTGLERSKGLSKDLEWFSQQDIVIPQPSNPGVAYVNYLEGLAENRQPLFLSHFYNIYFSHIAGGQVIAKQVSEKLLQGRELEFYKWEGNAEELFKGVREKLNMLGKHWSRVEKNRCLSETRKSLWYMGQIVRLIIL